MFSSQPLLLSLIPEDVPVAPVELPVSDVEWKSVMSSPMEPTDEEHVLGTLLSGLTPGKESLVASCLMRDSPKPSKFQAALQR